MHRILLSVTSLSYTLYLLNQTNIQLEAISLHFK